MGGMYKKHVNMSEKKLMREVMNTILTKIELECTWKLGGFERSTAAKYKGT